MRRVKFSPEPVLHVHRYIVRVGHLARGCWNTKYHYCLNLAEVKELRKDQKPGRIIEVFKADHNFKEAWEV